MATAILTVYCLAVGALLILFGWWLRVSLHNGRNVDAEIQRLRTAISVRDRILSPIIALADAGDYAAPLRISVTDAKRIKEELSASESA